MSDGPVITVRGLQKSYGRRPVLRDLSFEVYPGQLAGIVGENGAGKSTLLKCLVGLLNHDHGSITLRGRIGYCPQEPILLDSLTCAEQFELFAAGYRLTPTPSRNGVPSCWRPSIAPGISTPASTSSVAALARRST